MAMANVAIAVALMFGAGLLLLIVLAVGGIVAALAALVPSGARSRVVARAGHAAGRHRARRDLRARALRDDRGLTSPVRSIGSIGGRSRRRPGFAPSAMPPPVG
ncbi:MAG TPA: hypothetical protein VGH99_14015 [Pseudonocardia sp.]|jgi:hypothetical protein